MAPPTPARITLVTSLGRQSSSFTRRTIEFVAIEIRRFPSARVSELSGALSCSFSCVFVAFFLLVHLLFSVPEASCLHPQGPCFETAFAHDVTQQPSEQNESAILSCQLYNWIAYTERKIRRCKSIFISRAFSGSCHKSRNVVCVLAYSEGNDRHDP